MTNFILKRSRSMGDRLFGLFLIQRTLEIISSLERKKDMTGQSWVLLVCGSPKMIVY